MWEVSPVTLLEWVPWRAWECGWLAAGVDFAQNDWPLISQLVSQCHAGQSALGGLFLCFPLGLAHSRHSANICSMNYSVSQMGGLRLGGLDQLGGEEIPITTTPVHCLIIFLQLPVIDRAPV